MKNYIQLNKENYIQAIELGLNPMNWIKEQMNRCTYLLEKEHRVITYDGDILDIRKECNAIEGGFSKVLSVEELNK